MYDRILVAVDDDEVAADVFGHALSLARSMDATLYVLTVVEPTGSPMRFGVEEVDDIETTSAKLLETVLGVSEGNLVDDGEFDDGEFDDGEFDDGEFDDGGGPVDDGDFDDEGEPVYPMDEPADLADEPDGLADEPVEVDVEIRRGNAGEEILAYADEVNADLLVVGQHGSSGVVDVILGSTAEYLVRRGSRPVSIVPPSDANT